MIVIIVVVLIIYELESTLDVKVLLNSLNDAWGKYLCYSDQTFKNSFKMLHDIYLAEVWSYQTKQKGVPGGLVVLWSRTKNDSTIKADETLLCWWKVIPPCLILGFQLDLMVVSVILLASCLMRGCTCSHRLSMLALRNMHKTQGASFIIS